MSKYEGKWRSIGFVALASGIVLSSLATSNLTALGFREPITAELFFSPKLLLLSLALLIAGWAWLMDVRGGALVRPVPFQGLMAFALGAAAVSTVLGIQPLQSLMGSDAWGQGLITWILYVTIVYLTVQLVRSRRHARELAAVVVAVSGVVAAYGLLQAAGWDPSSWPGVDPWMVRHGLSTIGNPDMAASYLIFGLVLSPVLALTESRKNVRVAFWAAFAAIAASWLLATSRTAWVFGALALVATALYARRAALRLAVPAAVSAGAALIAGVAMLISHSDALERLRQILVSPVSAGGSRWLLWQAAVRSIAHRPLAGGGPDSFRLLWYPLRQASDLAIGGFNGVADDPHSLPLMLAATLGVPAAIALAAVLIGALWRTRSALGAPVHAGAVHQGAVLAAWLIAVTAYALTTLFGVLIVPNAVLLASGIGVLLASVSRKDATPRARAAEPYLVLAATLVVAVLASLQYSSDFLIARSDYSTGVEAIAQAREARNVMPFTYRGHLRVAELLDEQAASAVAVGAANAGSSVADARDEYRRLIAWNPAEYESYKRYLGFLVMTASATEGDAALTEVMDVAHRAMQVQPYGLSAGYFGAHAAMDLGRPQDAISFLAPVWKLDPNAPSQAGVLYADALAAAGKSAEARNVAESLIALHPADPDVIALAARLKTSGK